MKSRNLKSVDDMPKRILFKKWIVNGKTNCYKLTPKPFDTGDTGVTGFNKQCLICGEFNQDVQCYWERYYNLEKIECAE